MVAHPNSRLSEYFFGQIYKNTETIHVQPQVKDEGNQRL